MSTQAQQFSDAMRQLCAKRFEGYDAAKKAEVAVLCALDALVSVGLLRFHGTALSLPDGDPVVETRFVHRPEEVNAHLLNGWRLLGGDVIQGRINVLLGRPRSVRPEKTLDMRPAPAMPQRGKGGKFLPKAPEAAPQENESPA